jgi:hypothetical protein
MSTSPLSYPQRLNPGLIIRWLWKQSVTKQLAIVAGLAIFAQGCADLAAQSAYLASIQGEETETAATITTDEAGNIYAQRSQADQVREITERPASLCQRLNSAWI